MEKSEKKKPLPRDMTRVFEKKDLTIKKNLTTLSPLVSNQLRAYLLTFKPGEPVSISPDSKWNVFMQCGLTPSVFRKSLNTLAEAGHGTFTSHAGSVTFSLTPKGKKWLEGGC